MRVHALAILALPASLALVSSSLPADEVDDLIRSDMALRHVPGISIAVAKEGQVVKVGAYGLANVELEVPVTPRTRFQIQSITKTFTATGILLLAKEGKLSTDDPVGKQLEGTPEAWKDITIRRLLAHTSGIKDFINEPTASLRLDVTEEEVLAATAPRPLNFEPGTQYAYSNTNYHLLAMIIRKHTGLAYGDFLAQRVFKPLEMGDTQILSLSSLIPARASGYWWDGVAVRNGDFVAESILSYGGGGIVSTASDLARWGASFETEKILDRAAREEAWKPTPLKGGGESGYGLGWAVESTNGRRTVSHSGGHITGFASHLAIYPDDRLVVVVLANSRAAYPGRLAQSIAGHYVPALAPRHEEPIEDKEPEVTRLLRECVDGVTDWNLEESKFTPELWSRLKSQRFAIQILSKAMGRFDALALLRRSDSGDLRAYRYRATFANGTRAIVLLLARDGRIAALSVEPE